MSVYSEEDDKLTKYDILQIYKRHLSGKSVRIAQSVWWWNLSYKVERRVIK